MFERGRYVRTYHNRNRPLFFIGIPFIGSSFVTIFILVLFTYYLPCGWSELSSCVLGVRNGRYAKYSK